MTAKRQERVEFILNFLKNSRAAVLDRKRVIAVAAMEFMASERYIRELIQSLELTGKIDRRIWR